MSDNKINFTKVTLDSLSLPPTGQRLVYHDKKVNGLQIRVSSTGVKTFCVYRRIKNGNPERVTLSRYPDMSIEQARKEAIRINALIVEGINPNSHTRALKTEITLQELFEVFLKNRRNGRGAYLSEKTKKNYRYDFGLYLSKWGKRQLSQMMDIDFKKLHIDIGGKHPTTANRVIAMTSSLFAYASENKLFKGINPAYGIKKFPENKRDRFLQADELPAFFKSLENEPNKTLSDYFFISLLTGARRSNVQEMQWSQIHLDRAEWCIPVTKNGKPQTVVLIPEVIEKLRERQNNGSPWVFPGRGVTGHLVEPKKAWKRVLERAGIADVRIHDLRRTFGSWQAKTGASVTIVGKSLNHSSPISSAVYMQLDSDPVRESVEKGTSSMLVAGGIKQAEGNISSNRKRFKI